MKKILNYLLLMVGMIITQHVFGQTSYTVIYGMGIDTLYVTAGQKITKPLVFYEEKDQFTRGDPTPDMIITMSSHGYTFFVDHPKFSEDALAGLVYINEGTFVNDPNPPLVAMKDHRTGGDMREPNTWSTDPWFKKPSKTSDDSPSWPIPLASGLAIFAYLGFAKYKKWL